MAPANRVGGSLPATPSGFCGFAKLVFDSPEISTALVELRQFSLPGARGRILSDIDLSVLEGHCVQILGAAGQGKSLLLEVLAGQHRPSEGSRRYPVFEPTHPDARFGIAPRFAIKLVSGEAQRWIAASHSGFYQARWHSLWSQAQTVAEFLSPSGILGDQTL
jgi:energy-coupling factor transporter ATP-binding protein EcfA2